MKDEIHIDGVISFGYVFFLRGRINESRATLLKKSRSTF